MFKTQNFYAGEIAIFNNIGSQSFDDMLPLEDIPNLNGDSLDYIKNSLREEDDGTSPELNIYVELLIFSAGKNWWKNTHQVHNTPLTNFFKLVGNIEDVSAISQDIEMEVKIKVRTKKDFSRS